MATFKPVKYISTPRQHLDRIYKDGTLELWDARYTLYANSFCILRAADHNDYTALTICPDGKTLQLIDNRPHLYKAMGILPRNAEQTLLSYTLLKTEIPVLVLTGAAGVGKTILVSSCALHLLLEEKKFQKVILTRPMSIVGKKDLGTVPGDVKEKFSPYLLNYKTNFEQMLDNRAYLNALEDQGKIEYLPIQLMRGASFKDTFIIVDEAQTLSGWEMKAITTRLGPNCRIVILGDMTQRDDQKLKLKETGIYMLQTSELALHSPLCAFLELVVCERGPVAELMSRVF